MSRDLGLPQGPDRARIEPLFDPESRLSTLLFGFSLYAGTLFLEGLQVFYLLAMAMVLLTPGRRSFQESDLLLVPFLAWAAVNISLGFTVGSVNHTGNYLGVFVLPLLVLTGRYITIRAAEWFILFTSLEACTAMLQIAMGRRFFFARQAISGFGQDIDTGSNSPFLLYDIRPLGLSSNSSVLAMKLFVGVLLLVWFGKKIRHANWFWLLSSIGLIITFNRSAMVATSLLLCLCYGPGLIRKKGWKRTLVMGIGLVLVLGTVFFWDHLLTQFTRGQTDSGVGDVTTGRTDLWAEGIRFIRLHYLTGNFGVQFKVSFFNGPVHLHNSFLEVYATHGACSLILMLYIFRSITMRVLPFLMAIWFYSCFQYGIFWNFSPMDAVMYFFLAQGFQRSSQPNGSPSLEHPP